MSTEKISLPKLKNQEDCKVSLLDLSEWTLDYILEHLSPQDLCRLAEVCTCLRYKCRSDDLWEKQVKRKWGNKVLGDVAYQEWQWHITNINTERLLLQQNQNGSCGSYSGVWPGLCFHSYLENFRDLTSLLRNCSKMVLFICLETGRFWFPVQVYKKVKLLCYEAIVSYDSETDTFQARSTSTCSEWGMLERNIPWNRLRPVETFPMGFHMSNCMNDLKPGDYIEIQKRRFKGLPYDWSFAVVGHLESCDENMNHCRCQYSDMVVVEFKQYQQHSLLRRSVVNRNLYEEQRGSKLHWLGGIRKLYNEDEIQRWNSLSSP